MTREADKEQDLLGHIVFAVCNGTGLREELAMPIARDIMYVFQKEHGGERMYVPMPQRSFNVMQIVADLQAGKGRKVVCRDHNITRFQLSRILEDVNKKKVG